MRKMKRPAIRCEKMFAVIYLKKGSHPEYRNSYASVIKKTSSSVLKMGKAI